MLRDLHRAFALGVVVLGAAVSSPAPLSAQSPGSWRLVPSVNTPPPRVGADLVEAPTGNLWLMGGDAANPNASDWIWDGVDWRPSPPFSSPTPRRNDAVVSEFGANGAILFGGVTGSGVPLNDTWRWSAQSNGWFNVNLVSSPPPLSDKSMAYDVDGDRIVMIGLDLSGTWQTWFYATTTGWLAGATFNAAEAHVVEDPIRREVLRLTGRFPVVSVDTLDGAAWSPLTQAQQAFSIGELAFDARRGRVVAVQRYDSRETLDWDGLTFQGPSTPTGAFVAPSRTAMTYHGRRGELVLVSNYSGAMQTWRYVSDPQPDAVPFGDSCGTTTLALAAGDSPQPGAGHRLELSGNPGAFGAVMVLGFSHVQNQGLPLPQTIPVGTLGCDLQVEAAIFTVLGVSLPQSQLVTMPASASLLGERYDAQGLLFDGSGVVGASNGVEVQIGLPLVEQQLVESFDSDANRDPLASGDVWENGALVPATLGGDGRHGSFQPTESLQLSTDYTVIPGANTLDGRPVTVTDGRFYFTDLVVPAGVTVRFTGSVPAQLFVRGRVDVQGTISVDADDLPFFVPTSGPAVGMRCSTFDAGSLEGQPGGRGGAGGGRGGDGADKCLNAGPIFDGGVNVTNGQPGDDVQVSAAHAFAAQASGTGGLGSPLHPATGIWPNPAPPLIVIYVPYHSAGGGGGGFRFSGGVATDYSVSGGTVQSSLIAPGGDSFDLLPFPAQAPPGYSSLEHFSVGGSGGGGGGSHGFGKIGIGIFERWMAGSAGSGGGGVLVVRAGGGIDVGGTLTSRGGRGVIINGDSPAIASVDASYGISSPGGGGSGGSVLLQSDRGVAVFGSIDVRGGEGSKNERTAVAPLSGNGGAGAGSPGFYRAESNGFVTLSQASAPAPTPDNTGTLTDRDELSGSRSRWLLPSSPSLPIYERYELLVEIGGLPVLFSDDPAVSPVAADTAGGPVLVRFQGADVDPVTGQPIAASIGPWRTTLAPGADSVNRDRARTLRFDVVCNKTLGVTRVLELRLVYR